MIRKRLSNILKISGVYIGVTVGAGFASGQEIMSFFTVYGKVWVLGIILTGFLFSFLGVTILDIIYENKIRSYEEFMIIVMGKKLGKVMYAISGIFLCILFCTMVSASGSVAKEAFGIDPITGVFVMLLACFIVFLFETKGVVIVNSVLAPIMLFTGFVIGIYIVSAETVSVFNNNTKLTHNFRWIVSAFIYVSYNIITAVSVLVSVRDLVIDKKIVICSGIISGLAMALLGASIGFVMYLNYDNIGGYEIPMLAVVESYSDIIIYIYIIMLVCAIFTTALGNGFGAIKWIEEKTDINPLAIKIALILLGAMASTIGFSDFVQKFYHLFGYLGIIEIILILIYKLKN